MKALCLLLVAFVCFAAPAVVGAREVPPKTPSEASGAASGDAAGGADEKSGDAASGKSYRPMLEYILAGTAIAGIATGVTLVTVNHARVDDLNIDTQAYNDGVDHTPANYQALMDRRNSINAGERWGYIVGSIGVAAALGAAYLYVTDADGGASAPSGGVALGPGTLTVFGRF